MTSAEGIAVWERIYYRAVSSKVESYAPFPMLDSYYYYSGEYICKPHGFFDHCLAWYYGQVLSHETLDTEEFKYTSYPTYYAATKHIIRNTILNDVSDDIINAVLTHARAREAVWYKDHPRAVPQWMPDR